MSQDLQTRVSEALSLAKYSSLSISHLAEILEEVRDHLATETDRRIERAVSAMSYTEEQGLLALLDVLPDEGGLFIGGRIAIQLCISRSAIVYALQKLETAGLVQCQSLGMKGTRVKFLAQGARLRILQALHRKAGVPRAAKPAI